MSKLSSIELHESTMPLIYEPIPLSPEQVAIPVSLWIELLNQIRLPKANPDLPIIV
jgi:hypothetical protein